MAGESYFLFTRVKKKHFSLCVSPHVSNYFSHIDKRLSGKIKNRGGAFMQKTYFTFGTDPNFPYGVTDYVVIEALTQELSLKEYMRRYPCRSDDTLNCAFYYSEEEWVQVEAQYINRGVFSPVEHIVVAPTKSDIRNLVEEFIYTSWNSFILKTNLYNAFKGQDQELYEIVNAIQTHDLYNADEIMDRLDKLGYLDQICKKKEKEPLEPNSIEMDL